MPHFESSIFSFELFLPKKGTPLGCVISSDTYYNLPYIASFIAGTPLAQNLLQHGAHNSTLWVLSINSEEFITAEALVTYLRSLQLDTTTTYTTAFCVRRNASTRNSLESNRAIFNQIRLNYHQNLPNTPDPHPVILPVARRIVTSSTRPTTPSRIGELANNPFRSDWKGSLFENFDKMQTTGTFSAPMLRSQVPLGKAVLRSRIAFRVKDGDTAQAYDLSTRTCADGSGMREGVDFAHSYSPVCHCRFTKSSVICLGYL
jgi:hypothetical protein